MARWPAPALLTLALLCTAGSLASVAEVPGAQAAARPQAAPTAEAPVHARAAHAQAEGQAQSEAQALGSGVTVRLAELRAGYGLESWKDEPALGALTSGVPGVPAVPGLPGALPPASAGVYANPYFGSPHQGPQPWLGYNVTALLELADAGGAPVTGASSYVRASLGLAGGAEVPAKLARLAPGRFEATFDLDGEAGTDRPAAEPGTLTLRVEALEPAGAPGAADRRVAQAEFRLEATPARLDVGGLLLPDAALGYADTGPGNLTLVQPRLARPGEAFTVIADLGAADAAAALTAWHGATGAVLVQGRTDATGLFTATVDPAQLVGGEVPGLAVLAAHLTGDGARLGAAVLAVPVSDHLLRIDRMAFTGAAEAGPLDHLVVGVEDLSAPGPGEALAAPAARGTLHVLDAAGEARASVPFPPTSFGPGQREHEARVPAAALPGDDAAYRLVAVLHTAEGRVYSLAQAVRGFDVVVPPASGQAFAGGNLTAVVRSYTTNLDDVPDDGLAFPVRVTVTGLPGSNFTRDIRVAEAGEFRLRVPFLADAGDYAVEVRAEGGEFHRTASATLRVEAPRSGLPGFEAWLALAALGGLALHRPRTRA